MTSQVLTITTAVLSLASLAPAIAVLLLYRSRQRMMDLIPLLVRGMAVLLLLRSLQSALVLWAVPTEALAEFIKITPPVVLGVSLVIALLTVGLSWHMLRVVIVFRKHMP